MNDRAGRLAGTTLLLGPYRILLAKVLLNLLLVAEVVRDGAIDLFEREGRGIKPTLR